MRNCVLKIKSCLKQRNSVHFHDGTIPCQKKKKKKEKNCSCDDYLQGKLDYCNSSYTIPILK